MGISRPRSDRRDEVAYLYPYLLLGDNKGLCMNYKPPLNLSNMTSNG